MFIKIFHSFLLLFSPQGTPTVGEDPEYHLQMAGLEKV